MPHKVRQNNFHTLFRAFSAFVACDFDSAVFFEVTFAMLNAKLQSAYSLSGELLDWCAFKLLGNHQLRLPLRKRPCAELFGTKVRINNLSNCNKKIRARLTSQKGNLTLNPYNKLFAHPTVFSRKSA